MLIGAAIVGGLIAGFCLAGHRLEVQGKEGKKKKKKGSVVCINKKQ